jgi:hypothetical protein
MHANRRTDNEGNLLFFRQCPRAYSTHVTREGIFIWKDFGILVAGE